MRSRTAVTAGSAVAAAGRMPAGPFCLDERTDDTGNEHNQHDGHTQCSHRKASFFGFSGDSPDKPENPEIIRYFAFLNKAHTPTRTTTAAKTKPTMLPAPVNMLPNW